jgi:AraC-like DNA-binding protein
VGAPTAFLPEQRQRLLKQTLKQPLRNLFRELTGLPLHTWWHALAAETQLDGMIRCPNARRRAAAELPARCEQCLREKWPKAANADSAGVRFAGLCGSLNYCAGLNFLGHRLLTLQSQQKPPVPGAGRQAFRRAAVLAELIAHYLNATLQVQSAHRDSWRAGAWSAAPPLAEGLSRAKGPRARQVVGRLMDYIHRHYAHPFQLTEMAQALNLSSAYASDLFSTALGMTCHRYLEQVRLGKAKELLRDPCKRVREVAAAVGYTNPNHFRNVFSARVGRSPSAWRASLAAGGD